MPRANGKASEPDRRRFVEIARGSALECAAVQDVLDVYGGLSRKDTAEANRILDRMVAMLTKLGKRGYTVRESSLDQSYVDSDPDFDSNPSNQTSRTVEIPAELPVAPAIPMLLTQEAL